MTATDERQPRARRHPERGAARAPVALRRHLPAAADRRPRRRARAGPAAARRRRLRTAVRRSRATTPGSPSRSPTTACRRSACRRTRWTASRPEFRRRDGGPRGGARRRRREQPGALGGAARHARRARRHGRALARRRAPGGRRREGPPRPRGAPRRRADLASGLLPAADRAHLVRLQGRDRPAGGRGQRQSRRRTRRSGRSRPARSSSATPTRRASCRRCRRRTCSAATAPTSSSASCTRRVAAYRQYLRAQGREPRARRRCSAPRWSGAGRAALRSRSAPSATTPSSAATRAATTTSSTATIRAASSARPAPTPGARTRATRFDDEGSVDVRLHRMIRRGTSYGPMLPDGVLEDDGADRGHHLRVRRRAPQAPVRVRQDPVAERRHLHRRPAREGPARRRRTTAPAPSRSRSGRSGAGCRTLPPFVVTRGGEYCFAPGLRAMRWLAELET